MVFGDFFGGFCLVTARQLIGHRHGLLNSTRSAQDVQYCSYQENGTDGGLTARGSRTRAHQIQPRTIRLRSQTTMCASSRAALTLAPAIHFAASLLFSEISLDHPQVRTHERNCKQGIRMFECRSRTSRA
jgi:hypothetical protein